MRCLLYLQREYWRCALRLYTYFERHSSRKDQKRQAKQRQQDFNRCVRKMNEVGRKYGIAPIEPKKCWKFFKRLNNFELEVVEDTIEAHLKYPESYTPVGLIDLLKG